MVFLKRSQIIAGMLCTTADGSELWPKTAPNDQSLKNRLPHTPEKKYDLSCFIILPCRLSQNRQNSRTIPKLPSQICLKTGGRETFIVSTHNAPAAFNSSKSLKAQSNSPPASTSNSNGPETSEGQLGQANRKKRSSMVLQNLIPKIKQHVRAFLAQDADVWKSNHTKIGSHQK